MKIPYTIFISLLIFSLSTLGFTARQCKPNEFLCFDERTCFLKHKWCDNNYDCPDYSDENSYCLASSSWRDKPYFRCDNRKLIPLAGKCDGYPSCEDGSDEMDCTCENIIKETGSISFKVYIGSKRSNKCWNIAVSSTKYLILNITSLYLHGSSCDHAQVSISEKKSSSNPKTICAPSSHSDHFSENFDTTEIRYRGGYRSLSGSYDLFDIRYTLADLLCKNSDSFECTPNSCVASEKKCDGVQDCLNGADERGCERGVFAVPDVNVTLLRGVEWLRGERNAAWGWRDSTPRAVVALYLARGANFNGTDQEEDLTAKELELQMMTAILRNETDPVSPTQLAMYINSLLVICHDPKNFYGFNLVRILQGQMEDLTHAYHPLPYLALCNAGETLTDAAVGRLLSILESSSEERFLIDVQSVTIMALSCASRKGNYSSLKANITETTNRFKKEQSEDGSFGNIYTTALVIQALLASGSEEDKDWDLKAAIEFIQKKQSQVNGSFDDLLATSLILPILNAKSLADIGNINCTESLKMPRDGNPVSDIELRLGQKTSIKYSLYIGNEKDQIHPITLRTPANITVLDLMRLASEADPKYRFEAQSTEGKLYIYKLSGISNDPEDGKFWLLYTKSANETLQRAKKSPDEITVQNKEEIIMWYKSARIE